MKIYYSFLLMLLLTFAAVAQKDGPPVTFTGTITDASYAVIKGVNVFAEDTDGKVFQTVTGEAGDYEISLPKGDYVLRYVGGRGWADRTLLGFITSENVKKHYRLNVRLEVSLEGTMVSEMICDLPEPGSPLRNAITAAAWLKALTRP